MMARVYLWSMATALGMLLAGTLVLMANQQGYYQARCSPSTSNGGAHAAFTATTTSLGQPRRATAMSTTANTMTATGRGGSTGDVQTEGATAMRRSLLAILFGLLVSPVTPAHAHARSRLDRMAAPDVRRAVEDTVQEPERAFLKPTAEEFRADAAAEAVLKPVAV